MRPLAVALIAAGLTVGCGTHRAPQLVAAPGSPDALENYIRQVRVLSTAPRPALRGSGAAVEASDAPLREALAALAAAPKPTAALHRRVATEYRRLGVLDLAHAHFTSAVRLDPRDAVSHDALARIWRDWGFSYLGLGNAYNAVYFAPESPAAATTLATLLEKLGHGAAAERWFDKALTLDPAAGYALNNVCYVSLRAHRADAVDRCRRAYDADPESPIVRNNLALAYAVAGDLSRARELFDAGGDKAVAAYNMGVVFMARREYRLAVMAFHDALHEDPHLTEAAVRAQQAHELVMREAER